jgi:uncharacterized protein
MHHDSGHAPAGGISSDLGPRPAAETRAAGAPESSGPILGPATFSATLSATQKLVRSIEFTVLYGLIPSLAALYVETFKGLLLPSLVVGAALLTILLRRDPTFDRRLLWNAKAICRWWWRIVILVAAFAAVVASGVWIFERGYFFYLPRERPGLWLMIMFGYPLLSVFPQEIIFRTWFFHRYGPLFGDRWLTIFASTITFGFAHLMFKNPIALLLTTLGGFVFARTYDRSRSTFVVAVEHALYGAVIFTIGLGRFFYLGAVGD